VGNPAGGAPSAGTPGRYLAAEIKPSLSVRRRATSWRTRKMVPTVCPYRMGVETPRRIVRWPATTENDRISRPSPGQACEMICSRSSVTCLNAG
jgi:hypothetical protein